MTVIGQARKSYVGVCIPVFPLLPIGYAGTVSAIFHFVHPGMPAGVVAALLTFQKFNAGSKIPLQKYRPHSGWKAGFFCRLTRINVLLK